MNSNMSIKPWEDRIKKEYHSVLSIRVEAMQQEIDALRAKLKEQAMVIFDYEMHKGEADELRAKLAVVAKATGEAP